MQTRQRKPSKNNATTKAKAKSKTTRTARKRKQAPIQGMNPQVGDPQTDVETHDQHPQNDMEDDVGNETGFRSDQEDDIGSVIGSFEAEDEDPIEDSDSETEEEVGVTPKFDHRSSSKRQRIGEANAVVAKMVAMESRIQDLKRKLRKAAKKQAVPTGEADDPVEIPDPKLLTPPPVFGKEGYPPFRHEPAASRTSSVIAGSIGTPSIVALTASQKEANRTMLMDRCSQGFLRRDFSKMPQGEAFTGSSEQDFDEFLKSFELKAFRSRWNEAEKIVGLLDDLKGAAATTYLDLMSSGTLIDATFYEATQKLKGLFPRSSLRPVQAMSAFMGLKQGARESVSEFYSRLRRMAEQAVLDENCDLVISRFCDAVRPELRQHLLRFVPDGATPSGYSLREVMGEAIRVETYLGDSGCRRTDAMDTDEDEDLELLEEQNQRQLVARVSKKGNVTVRAISKKTPSSLDVKAKEARDSEPTDPVEVAVIRRIQAIFDAHQEILDRQARHDAKGETGVYSARADDHVSGAK